MPRTLLPIFSAYKVLNGVNAKEAPETFDWMANSEREQYEPLKNSLDNIPGSREFLKNYTHNHEIDDGYSFDCEMSSKIITPIADNHSGSSLTFLLWSYKYLLNNWNEFVYKTKERYLRKTYDENQFTAEDINSYTVTDPSSTLMIENLKQEINNERIAMHEQKEKDWFKGRVDVLKHHYKFPNRWFDSLSGSNLFGSPDNITPAMMNAVEEFYPDYYSHVMKITMAYKAHLAFKKALSDGCTQSEINQLQDYAIEIRWDLFDPPEISKEQIDELSKRIPNYGIYIEKVLKARLTGRGAAWPEYR